MLTKIKTFFARFPISFTASALIYPILLIAALVFAQVNKTALSHAVFVFVLVLPLGAILYIVAAVACLRTAVRVSETTVEKKAVVSLFANVTNRGPLPLALAEVELMIPGGRISHSDTARVMMTLLPFSGGQIARGVEFPRRGEYDVGISCIYVYDLTRSVKVRVRIGKIQKVFVLPRRLSLPSKEVEGQAYSAQVSTPLHNADAAEAFDTRPYAAGDNLKRVHWKLSSKSEELIVRDDASLHGASVCLMCDLEAYFAQGGDGLQVPREEGTDEIDYIGADAVVEMALAIASRELRARNTVLLSWIEHGEAVSVRLTSLADYEAVFRIFGGAQLDAVKGHVIRICNGVDFGDALPIIVCPYLSEERTSEYAARFGGASDFSSPTLLVFSDESLFMPDKVAQIEIDKRIRRLTNVGLKVIKFKL